MSQGVNAIIYPVKDVVRAKALFGLLLGVKPYADQPSYVGFKAGDLDVGLDPNGHCKGMTGPVAFYEVDDIKTNLQRLLDEGAAAVQEIHDVGGGTLIASVKDADGNMMGLRQMPS